VLVQVEIWNNLRTVTDYLHDIEGYTIRIIIMSFRFLIDCDRPLKLVLEILPAGGMSVPRIFHFHDFPKQGKCFLNRMRQCVRNRIYRTLPIRYRPELNPEIQNRVDLVSWKILFMN